MVYILAIEPSEVEFFYDLAGCTHSNWPEINEYLASNKHARDAVRAAKECGLTGEEFLSIVLMYSEEKQKQSKKPEQAPIQLGE